MDATMTVRPAPSPRLASMLALAFSLLGCEKPQKPAQPAVHIAQAEPSKTPESPADKPKREGIRLGSLRSIGLFAVGETLLVTSRAERGDKEQVQFYVARGDSLEREPKLDLPEGPPVADLRLAGHFPDKLLAFTIAYADTGTVEKLLQWSPSGWTELKKPEHLRSIASFAGGVYGLVYHPVAGSTNAILELGANTSPIPIPLPQGEGAECDAFYAKRASMFPKLAVQPRGINEAFGTLFVLGMGCDAHIALAAFAQPKSPPTLHSIPTPTFFDGFPGKIVGKSSSDFWFFRRPMRPMTLATLFHYDGKTFQEIAWPSEDPQAEDVAADPSGTLWAVIDTKLFEKRPDSPFREKHLPQGCEAQALLALDDSLWIACADAVARISTAKKLGP